MPDPFTRSGSILYFSKEMNDDECARKEGKTQIPINLYFYFSFLFAFFWNI